MKMFRKLGAISIRGAASIRGFTVVTIKVACVLWIHIIVYFKLSEQVPSSLTNKNIKGAHDEVPRWTTFFIDSPVC